MAINAEAVPADGRPKKSRAAALRDSVEVRLAVDAAGPIIADVLRENGVVLASATWDRVFPFWLLAARGDDVLAVCQVAIAQPVGYVEFLHARPSAPFKLRAIALRKLIAQSMATVYHSGAQYVAGTVSTKNTKFRNVLEDLHFVKVDDAVLMAKRLTR